ncbi:MAG TPA: PEP-CTERM sorting domain-containing protein, partial [Caldimonas sp.]
MKSARAIRLSACTVLAILALPAAAGPFGTTNLVSDDPTVHAAQITDPNLVNAWGLSYSPTSPFWVSANGTGTANLYSV